jgi:hypothetical protein
VVTLAQWAIRQFSGLRVQVDATDDAARQELGSILDRLMPTLNPGRQDPTPSYDHPPTQEYPQALR